MQKKQKEKREEEDEELKKIKNKEEIWRYINKKRDKRLSMGNNIRKKEWRRHFMELLDEAKIEEMKVKGKEKEEVARSEEEAEIGEVEIWRVIKKIKKKKAAGVDGIPTEAWIYAGEGLTKKWI